MKKRRKSRKGIIRVSKSGIRYRKSSKSRTGWVRVGGKKRKKRATKRRKSSRKPRRTRKSSRKARRTRLTW